LRTILLLLLLILKSIAAFSQENTNLDYFRKQAIENAPTLNENKNLLKRGEIENSIIDAQNNAFLVNATSEVLVAPYFNTNSQLIAITTTPSSKAFGYDVGITNGGLYAAQVLVTKNLFNKVITENLLFQNKIINTTIAFLSEELTQPYS
jgi:hypothetical protein